MTGIVPLSIRRIGMPDLIAEPGFAPPNYSVYESRKHAWVEIVGEGIDHYE